MQYCKLPLTLRQSLKPYIQDETFDERKLNTYPDLSLNPSPSQREGSSLSHYISHNNEFSSLVRRRQRRSE
jgi:hypothetical protein